VYVFRFFLLFFFYFIVFYFLGGGGGKEGRGDVCVGKKAHHCGCERKSASAFSP
jgi:hypothetical protein